MCSDSLCHSLFSFRAAAYVCVVMLCVCDTSRLSSACEYERCAADILERRPGCRVHDSQPPHTVHPAAILNEHGGRGHGSRAIGIGVVVQAMERAALEDVVASFGT